MRRFPALVAQDVRLEGGGYLEAAADITLSSAGKHVLHHPRGRSLLGSEAMQTSTFYWKPKVRILSRAGGGGTSGSQL